MFSRLKTIEAIYYLSSDCQFPFPKLPKTRANNFRIFTHALLRRTPTYQYISLHLHLIFGPDKTPNIQLLAPRIVIRWECHFRIFLSHRIRIHTTQWKDVSLFKGISLPYWYFSGFVGLRHRRLFLQVFN